MLRLSAGFVGIFGAALILTDLAHSAFDWSASAGAGAGDVRAAVVRTLSAVNRQAKADRWTSPDPAPELAAVTSVELIGVTNTTIILRDESGRVVFQSDPISNVTLVSKDADLPTVTVKTTARSPAARKPVEGRDTRDKGRAVPPGCESMVGSLVDSDLRRTPRLCLARADIGRRS